MNELEQRVMQMLLAGDNPALEALRIQLDSAKVSDRKFTGSGFLTEFQAPTDAQLLPGKQNFVIEDLVGHVSGRFCGFLLFIKNGAFDFLEGHVWGAEDWPDPMQIESLRYLRRSPADSRQMIESELRDVEALQAILYSPPDSQDSSSASRS
jgi:hypothetical protein